MWSGPTNLTDWVLLAQILTPLILLVSAFFAFQAFRINAAANKFVKSIDVIAKCSDRYDAIHVDRSSLDRWDKAAPGNAANDPRDVERVYKRFWALQQFQHDMFILGVIETEVYLSWMNHKVRLFQQNEVIGGLSFRDGWDRYGRISNQEHEAFVGLFNSLRDAAINRPGVSAEKVVEKLVADHRKQYGARKVKWFNEGFELVTAWGLLQKK